MLFVFKICLVCCVCCCCRWWCCCCCCFWVAVIATADVANVVSASDDVVDVTGHVVNEDKVVAFLLVVPLLLLPVPFAMTAFLVPSGGNGVVIFIPPIIRLLMWILCTVGG